MSPDDRRRFHNSCPEEELGGAFVQFGKAKGGRRRITSALSLANESVEEEEKKRTRRWRRKRRKRKKASCWRRV